MSFFLLSPFLGTRYKSSMGKKVAVLQSNYIPWKGYFDLIAAVDEFILYDDVQFTKNDWRNRNQIKTPRGLEWLSIPVGQNISRNIRNVAITTHDWQAAHWAKLEANYKDAPHFKSIARWLKPLYLDETYTNLSALNRRFIEAICAYLGIDTKLSWSWDYTLIEGKSERLVDLCTQAGATIYISGPAAKDYLKTELFKAQGIRVEWFDYAGYPEYPQLWGDFTHQVSILDLLLNVGQNAPKFMQTGRP